MRITRLRGLVVAAAACAAVALLPGSAGAHPVDCDSGPLAAAPTAERFSSDWTASNGCTISPADRSAEVGIAEAAPAPVVAPRSGSLKQVGRNPLMNRGMNAAIAVHGDYAYVGSRTDGGHAGQPQGGIMVLDISDPSEPDLLGRPFDAKPGESSRELRVWRSHDVLIVLNTNCGVGPALHHCTQSSISNIRFYDIAGANAKRPKLLSEPRPRSSWRFLDDFRRLCPCVPPQP